MDEVYQKLIDRTRAPLDLKQMKTIFGHSHRPYNRAARGRKPPELVKAVQAPSQDLTVFKIKWGNLTLKIYPIFNTNPLNIAINKLKIWCKLLISL